MRYLLLLMSLIPFTLLGQQREGQQIVVNKSDSQTLVINVLPFPETNVLSDSVVLKSLLEKLNSKDGKSFWDRYSGLFIALIPLIIGYFAYRYTRSHNIANARLEWIKNFRPLVSRYITGTLKSQTALEELSEAGEIIEEHERLVKESAERLSELLAEKKSLFNTGPKTKELKEKIIAEEKIGKDASSNREIAKKEFQNLYEKYKIENFDLYQSLNEVLVSLDPQTYGSTHNTLSQTINELLDYNFHSGRIGFDKLIDKARFDIQKVLAEQWQLAEGTRQL